MLEELKRCKHSYLTLNTDLEEIERFRELMIKISIRKNILLDVGI